MLWCFFVVVPGSLTWPTICSQSHHHTWPAGELLQLFIKYSVTWNQPEYRTNQQKQKKGTGVLLYRQHLICFVNVMMVPGVLHESLKYELPKEIRNAHALYKQIIAADILFLSDFKCQCQNLILNCRTIDRHYSTLLRRHGNEDFLY